MDLGDDIKCIVHIKSKKELRKLEAVCSNYNVGWMCGGNGHYHGDTDAVVIRDVFTHASLDYCDKTYPNIIIITLEELVNHPSVLLEGIYEHIYIPEIKQNYKSQFYPKITMILNQTN